MELRAVVRTICCAHGCLKLKDGFLAVLVGAVEHCVEILLQFVALHVAESIGSLFKPFILLSRLLIRTGKASKSEVRIGCTLSGTSEIIGIMAYREFGGILKVGDYEVPCSGSF